MNKPQNSGVFSARCGTQYGFEEAQALLDVLSANAPCCGRATIQFEAEFADYCGMEHALAVSSGYTAMQMAMLAAKIRPGSEIIVPALSELYTLAPLYALGAKLIFCDIDARTYNMDADQLKKRLSEQTRGVVVSHMYGQCADMVAINAAVHGKDIVVIEDCSHSPGASLQGMRSGSMGDLSVFNLDQGMNLSTLGEGGMLLFRDRTAFLSAYKNRYVYERGEAGQRSATGRFSGRITDAQCAVGRVQLRRLDAFNALRQSLAQQLTQGLQSVNHITLPYVDSRGKHVYSCYALALDEDAPLSRDDFMRRLFETYGIETDAPQKPVYHIAPYLTDGVIDACAGAEDVVKRLVLLPLNPRMQLQDADYMTSSIRSILT